MERQESGGGHDVFVAGVHATAKKRAALLSIFSNSCLTLLKLATGLGTGSVAILSEAAHSAVDLLAAFMAYISLRIAVRPADAEHPYGHGKAESIAALLEALLILGAGLFIIKEAIVALMHPAPMPGLGFGALVMAVAGLVNLFVSRHLFAVGKKTESDALVADAWHLRTDVYSSFGVFAALAVILLGEHFFPGRNLAFLDPLCALIVALLILKAGGQLCVEAASKLLDQSLSDSDIALIMDHIRAEAPWIKGHGAIRTRRSGSRRIIYMELVVDKDMSVHDGHELGNALSERIREHFPDSQIEFHLEPEARTGK